MQTLTTVLLSLCSSWGFLVSNALDLSLSEKQTLLDSHNEYRSFVARGTAPFKPFATNMNSLFWDPALTLASSDWLQQCKYSSDPQAATSLLSHNSSASFVLPQDLASYDIGVNLGYFPFKPPADANTSSSLDAYHFQQVLELLYDWFLEESLYTYSNAYNQKYHHFLQLMWAQTRYVGCATVRCPNGAEGLDADARDVGLLQCYYYPSMFMNGLEEVFGASAVGDVDFESYVQHNLTIVGYPYQTVEMPEDAESEDDWELEFICSECESDRCDTCDAYEVGLCTGCMDKMYYYNGCKKGLQTCGSIGIGCCDSGLGKFVAHCQADEPLCYEIFGWQDTPNSRREYETWMKVLLHFDWDVNISNQTVLETLEKYDASEVLVWDTSLVEEEMNQYLTYAITSGTPGLSSPSDVNVSLRYNYDSMFTTSSISFQCVYKASSYEDARQIYSFITDNSTAIKSGDLSTFDVAFRHAYLSLANEAFLDSLGERAVDNSDFRAIYSHATQGEIDLISKQFVSNKSIILKDTGSDPVQSFDITFVPSEWLQVIPITTQAPDSSGLNATETIVEDGQNRQESSSKNSKHKIDLKAPWNLWEISLLVALGLIGVCALCWIVMCAVSMRRTMWWSKLSTKDVDGDSAGAGVVQFEQRNRGSLSILQLEQAQQKKGVKRVWNKVKRSVRRKKKLDEPGMNRLESLDLGRITPAGEDKLNNTAIKLGNEPKRRDVGGEEGVDASKRRDPYKTQIVLENSDNDADSEVSSAPEMEHGEKSHAAADDEAVMVTGISREGSSKVDIVEIPVVSVGTTEQTTEKEESSDEMSTLSDFAEESDNILVAHDEPSSGKKKKRRRKSIKAFAKKVIKNRSSKVDVSDYEQVEQLP